MAGTYDPSQIQVLEGLEPIRRRAGMYVGDVSSHGLYNLLWGLVELDVERRQHFGSSALAIEIDDHSLVTIRDDGDGLPVDAASDRRALETLFATMQGRMFGVSAHAITNALSERLVVETTRDGERWTQSYARGTATTEVVSVGRSSERGTTIRFRPDPTIFPSIAFDLDVIAERLQAFAWLTPRISISWQGRRLIGTGGLTAWAKQSCAGQCEMQLTPRSDAKPDADVESLDAVDVEVALAWRGDGAPVVRGFVDITVTPHGPHVDAMWSGLTKLASRIIEMPLDEAQTRARLAPGLVAIVRVTLPEPVFADQTKEKLSSENAGTAVEHAFARADISLALRRFLLARLL